MKFHGLVPLTFVVIATLFTVAGFADETGIQGVSPGTPDRSARIGSSCPTFNWEAAAGVEFYEIVVYRLVDEVADVSSVDLSTSIEVLYTTVPGRATGWTPEAADCFTAGERYAWFVRAVIHQGIDEAGEWSEPRFFEVASAPTADELGRAIEVIRRWEAAGAGGSTTLSADAVPDPVPAAATDSVADSGSGSTETKSVITGTAAIRGEQPDFTGETYGVVGINASPDGAGIGAANITGGPDLVLDGAVPAEFTEAGVDRSSASPQTFSFSNTGGGGLMLDVDGVEVVTTATDRDTIGSLTCGSGQLAKWNGSGWVCAPDLNSDTLSGLSCATWQIPKWNGSAWECYMDWDSLFHLGCGPGQIPKHDGSSWTCAVDNDTTYSLGPGLYLDGDQIRIDSSAFLPTISTLDINPSVSMVGKYNSVAIGTDGLGLISYYEEMATNDLKVSHCNDIQCTNATISTVDGGPESSGWYSSIAIGSDDLGLISYYDSTALTLKVAHCNDTPCTSASISTLDNTGGAGSNTSITIGIDGLGLISYYDNTNDDLKVAKCHDVACSSATVTTLDSTGDVGLYSSIAIGPQGLGVISYRDETNGNLKLAQCSNVTCTTASISTLDYGGSGSGTGLDTSVALGADGLALIAYRNHYDNTLMVAHCNNDFCTSTTKSVVKVGSVGYVSLAIADDGFGLITFTDFDEHALKVAHCRDAKCSSATTRTVANVYVWHTSIALGSDDHGLISYYDSSNYALKVAHLPYGY